MAHGARSDFDGRSRCSVNRDNELMPPIGRGAAFLEIHSLVSSTAEDSVLFSLHPFSIYRL